MKNYLFFLETVDGIVMTWTGLTQTAAKAMYKATDQKFNEAYSSTQIKRYGWEEMK